MTTTPSKAANLVTIGSSDDLIERYARPVPRYTSYPTADRFSDGFGPTEFGEALARSSSEGRPMAWYIHLPFCARMCAYCGCNMAVSQNPDTHARYLARLEKEIEQVSQLLLDGALEPPVATGVHFGGGTPNTHRPETIAGIVESLELITPFTAEAERSIEIDPRLARRGDVRELGEAGFHRLSMGVQDLDQKVQKAIGREQSLEQTAMCVNEARTSGFDSVNIDLIYGLPYQTPEGFGSTLEAIVDLAPDRIALFGYAHLPKMRANQRVIPEEALPSSEERLALYEQAASRLGEAGYAAIGLDHFATQDDPLAVAQREGRLHRTFQGYTVVGGVDLVGVGMSAISCVGGAYAQNARRLDDYNKAIDERGLATIRGLRLTEADQLRARLIEEVMCNHRVDWSGWSGPVAEVVDGARAQLDLLSKDGLVEMRPSGLEVTSRGRPLVRHVAAAFDAFLDETSAGRYSVAV